MAKLVGLCAVGVALALFLDLGVVALIATGDPEHALPLTAPTALVLDVLAVFAAYQVWRKRRG